jgi:hypothetical protein
MYGVLISENECRREDDPLLKSVKAQRLIDMGKTVEEVAIAFGVKRQSVEAWLNLGEVAQPVREAVERGEISATAASHLHTLPREEQVKTFEAMKDKGGKVTVQRAKQAVREGDASPKPPRAKMLGRDGIESELEWLSKQDIEINVEFYEGFKNALRWVLGLSMVWLAWQRGVSSPEERAEDVEAGADECAGRDGDAEIRKKWDETNQKYLAKLETEAVSGSGDERQSTMTIFFPKSPKVPTVGSRPVVGLTEEVRQEWLAAMKPEAVNAMRARRLVERDGGENAHA